MTLSDLGPFPEESGYDVAIALDRSDPLRDYRSRYLLADPDLIYLDGNSLGRLPLTAAETVEDVIVRQWGERLIRSWNDGWWDLQIRLGDKLAPILGARAGEVIISDATSVNLYKLAHAAAASMPPEREKIVTDDLNFPSDVYILDSIAAQTGKRLDLVASDGIHGPVEALSEAIDERTALVSLSHTVFQSGYTYDLAGLTNIAHEAGALILWDCSHSVGVLPIDLEGAGVDLAVGCTYKHLNGGPGSPAFLYVREDHQDRLSNPITGWWSHDAPFALDLEYRPVSGIRRFHTGTMPILSLAAIEAGIDDVLEATIEAIRAKSIALSRYLLDQFHQHLTPLGFELASPEEPTSRGSHVSIRHEDAWPIDLAMIDLARVIPDFRAPDTIRLGLSPLYNRFIDIHTAVQRTARLVTCRAYEGFGGVVSNVT